ncbi:MAG: FGGY-family carbohydrate kinase [Acidimicrobiia bacterium]|nr:FGGY-family carbohydrate kinase [Acidimicrobiia bacterium]
MQPLTRRARSRALPTRRGRFLPLVCTLNAAKVTDAVGRLLGASREELAALALDAAPGAGGVVLVPYFDGERTPNRPDATGTLAGLRSDLTREQVARAGFEGVVCGLLDAKDALDAVGVDTSGGRLFLVGGGARSTAYSTILADLAERPVTVLDDADHVATGACVQAAAVVTGSDPADIATAWSLGGGETVEPDPHVDSGAVRAAYRHAAR